MAATNSLQTYLERYALITLEKQDKLESLIGESMHELDLDAGIIRFNDLQFPMQVLGTESDNTLTWLWAWSDEQTEIPSSLMQSAIQLRNWGATEGIPEFTLPSLDLNRADGHIIALIGAEICKASCYYRDRYEGGAVLLLLFDKLIDNQPPFNRERLLRRLSDIFSQYEINHRNALLSYLRSKELPPVEERNVVSFALESGERLNAEFDTVGRLIAVNGVAFEG
ncbi:MAG TPA: hypothetical protein VL122_06960 [Nitrospirota bacterium]|nr:hypothetical protein [Nitrospirota bacterium]